MTGWELKKKYRIIHVHFDPKEGIIALCLEPLEKLTPPQGAISPMGQTVEGRLAQETVGAIMRHMPGVGRPKHIMIEITVDDYEKMGKPGILEETTLTLTGTEAEKE